MRASLCILLALAFLPITVVLAEEEAPAPGTMRFSKTADAFPKDAKPVFTGEDTIYALCGFGKPWRELMRKADKGTSAVIKLYEGNTQKRSAAFYPGEAAFQEDTFVLEIVPDPATATQFPYFIVDTLSKYPPGTYELKVELWSFDATTKDHVLAQGALTFKATAAGQTRLAGLVKALKEARKRRQEKQSKPEKPKPPQGPLVKVRHDGADFLQIRGKEIVKDGAVVGSFDGTSVRKGGSIVGEIKGKVFRHEGSDRWHLDKGNLYPGIEIRWEGAIIGSIEKSGRITWEGSEWGHVKPYEGTEEETMRIFAALWYFSDYFRKK